MNILVTGATGFIGRHLVRRLAHLPHTIFCVVRKTSDIGIVQTLGAKLIYADITDYDLLRHNIREKIDTIFHCAALVENKNRQLLFKTNVVGTENICRFALERRVKRLVYTSSVAVVSGNSRVPLTEDLPYSTTTLYGESKIEAEKVVLKYRGRGLRVAIMRPSMVYGEDEPHLLKGLLRLLRYRLLPLVNRGRAKLHLAYVENVVESLLFAFYNDVCLGQPLFIADREVLTAQEAFCTMAEAIGAPHPIELSERITGVITKLPFLGVKARVLLKDREYSTERLASFGFKHPHRARESLFQSCQKCFTTHIARRGFVIEG